MYHAITGIPTFGRDHISFLFNFPSYDLLWAEVMIRMSVIFDKCITDYNDIFKSVTDFACKNMIAYRLPVKSGGRYSPLEYYDLEITYDHKLHYYLMQNWTYDLNKYIMSRFDGNWIRISENKYTLTR